MSYYGNSSYVPPSLMGPSGGNFSVNMTDLQAFLKAQSQTALVPKGKASKSKNSINPGILALGGPQQVTALALVPSAGRALASAVPNQGYGIAVQDFNGALSVVNPKKAAKPKPPKFKLALESNVDWPIDPYQEFSLSAGRIVDVTEPKPVPKLTKKAVQKLLKTPSAVGGQKSIPWIPENPTQYGANSGHLVQLKHATKPKKPTATVTSNPDFPGVGYREPTFSQVKKERKPAPAKKKTSVPEFQHQLEGEIRYTFQMTDAGSKKKISTPKFDQMGSNPFGAFMPNMPFSPNANEGKVTKKRQEGIPAAKKLKTDEKDCKKAPQDSHVEKIVAKKAKTITQEGKVSAKKPDPKKVTTKGPTSFDSPSKPNPKKSGPPKNAQRWTVSQVVEFVAGLAGCASIKEIFRTQAIDGRAFLLLKPEHLTGLGLKMGPALKISSEIEALNQSIWAKPPPSKKTK